MRAGGWSRKKILLLWVGTALVCACATAAGYGALGDASNFMLAFIQAFAGGAILMMLADTMIPEGLRPRRQASLAFEHDDEDRNHEAQHREDAGQPRTPP